MNNTTPTANHGAAVSYTACMTTITAILLQGRGAFNRLKQSTTKTIAVVFVLTLTSTLNTALCQVPGGVKGVEQWMKTVPVGSDLQGSYKWKDFSGDSARLNNYDSRGAAYGTEVTQTRSQIRTYNFNPALDLGNGESSKALLLGKTNLAQGTIIGVWGSYYSDFDQDMVMYNIEGRAGEGNLISKDKVIQSQESGRTALDYGETEGMDHKYSSNDQEKTVNKFRERALRVQTYYRLNQPVYGVWGERQKAVYILGYYYPTGNINITSSYNTAEFNNRRFWGYTPELITYNRYLTTLERIKIESYLAIKYGFTQTNSYISSRDKLLWDLAANEGYNTRITGLYRDDLSGLTQPAGTTSFEEAPYYSDDYPNGFYDSYDGNNSNNRPSRYRLLVMSRPYGTNMKDGEYTMWGDDDQSYRVQSRVIGGMKTMSRNWKVRSNVEAPPNSAMAQKDLWSYSNLQMAQSLNSTLFIKDMTDNTSTGTAVSQQALSGPNGYMGWTSGTIQGGVTVKFGTQNPSLTAGSHDYGYYISNVGQVFPIVAGVRKTSYIATLASNQKIEIEKTAVRLQLRINGNVILGQDIQIAASDTGKMYYGTLLLEKQPSNTLRLYNFTAGGFYYGNSSYGSNGGHRIELSYEGQRATDFLAYRNGQAYLIIDRSGTGTYPLTATDYYLNDETDEGRYKIIFNNIRWDEDGSGSDVFTFGYLEAGKLAISVDSLNPSCTNGKPNKDGIIKIGIESGLRGYNYTVVNTNDTTVKRNGRFFEDSLILTGLPIGKYTINLSEIGGYNFWVDGQSAFRPASVSTGSLIGGTCSVDFLAGGLSANGNTVKDNDGAVGFKVAPSGFYVPASGYEAPDYGVWKKGDALYAVVNKAIESTAFATVTTGDKITIEHNSTNIIYKVNGVEKARRTVLSADQSKYFFAMVNLSATGSRMGEVCNVTVTGLTAEPWVSSENITVKKSALAKTTATATLKEACNITPPPQALRAPDNHLILYNKIPDNLKTFTAKVTLDNPGNATLLVYSMSGELVYKVDLNANMAVQEADITLQGSGVYIVKAITTEGEFSKQIVVQ